MDRDRISAITHGDRAFHNPLDPARVAEALDTLGPGPRRPRAGRRLRRGRAARRPRRAPRLRRPRRRHLGDPHRGGAAARRARAPGAELEFVAGPRGGARARRRLRGGLLPRFAARARRPAARAGVAPGRRARGGAVVIADGFWARRRTRRSSRPRGDRGRAAGVRGPAGDVHRRRPGPGSGSPRVRRRTGSATSGRSSPTATAGSASIPADALADRGARVVDAARGSAAGTRGGTATIGFPARRPQEPVGNRLDVSDVGVDVAASRARRECRQESRENTSWDCPGPESLELQRGTGRMPRPSRGWGDDPPAARRCDVCTWVRNAHLRVSLAKAPLRARCRGEESWGSFIQERTPAKVLSIRTTDLVEEGHDTLGELQRPPGPRGGSRSRRPLIFVWRPSSSSTRRGPGEELVAAGRSSAPRRASALRRTRPRPAAHPLAEPVAGPLPRRVAWAHRVARPRPRARDRGLQLHARAHRAPHRGDRRGARGRPGRARPDAAAQGVARVPRAVRDRHGVLESPGPRRAGARRPAGARARRAPRPFTGADRPALARAAGSRGGSARRACARSARTSTCWLRPGAG